MARMYFSDFTDHCLKFYFRHSHPNFHSDVDRLDWQAAESTISKVSDRDRRVLEAVYTGKERFISENIKVVSRELGLSENVIYDLLDGVRKKLAIARGIYFDKLR